MRKITSFILILALLGIATFLLDAYTFKTGFIRGWQTYSESQKYK